MWSTHYNVNMFFLERTREYLRQSVRGQQRLILVEIVDSRILLE
jgi:hypothetical protein